MATDDRSRLAAARGLSLLQRYHDGERNGAAVARLAAEVECLVAWLIEHNLAEALESGSLLRPVRAQLLEQYGSEVGGDLFRTFIESFKAAWLRFATT